MLFLALAREAVQGTQHEHVQHSSIIIMMNRIGAGTTALPYEDEAGARAKQEVNGKG